MECVKFLNMKLNNRDASVNNSSATSIKVFENPEFGKVRTVVISGDPWFVGNDVAGVLGYKYPKDAIRDNVDDDDKMVVKLSDIQERIPDHMKGSKITIVNKRGLSNLIFKSEKLSKKDKDYFIKIFDVKSSFYSRKEIEFKDELFDFFKSIGLNVLHQNTVGKYRVDFYIPYLNLVIEYDESEHSNYNINNEKAREAFILNALKCKIIRISDKNSNAYNLGLITKELFINKQDFKVKPCYK